VSNILAQHYAHVIGFSLLDPVIYHDLTGWLMIVSGMRDQRAGIPSPVLIHYISNIQA